MVSGLGRPLATNDNTKLGKAVLSFGITAGPVADGGSCPDATKLCARVCYTKKGHYAYPNVAQGYVWRLEATQEPDFVERMATQLRKTTRKIFRIHSTGDFYSSEYIDKWAKIVSMFPDIKFFTYTRAWMDPDKAEALERLRSLSNIQVFASYDQSTPIPPPEGWRLAIMRYKEYFQSRDHEVGREHTKQVKAVHCMEQTGAKADCGACRFCSHGFRGNVEFKIH